jgi:hypothetical protein
MPYLGDILPEDADGTFDPESDVKEIIGDDQPGGGDTFSLQNGESTLVYLIDWLKARSFLRSCLGFSYADEGAPYQLHRENPWVHPRFTWLRAGTVSFSATAPAVNASSTPADRPNFPAVFADKVPSKTAYYQKCYATVRFVGWDFPFLEDSEISSFSDELRRNVSIDLTPSVEMLSAEGPLGQMKWTETGAGGAQPAIGSPINTPFGTLVAKATYSMTWHHVPEEYLSNDPLFFYPRNILEHVGKVNSAEFGTFDVATALLMPPKFQRFRFPVSTFDGKYPFWGWNVTIPLVYFQPRPRGASAPSDDGYRLLPWAANLKWYAAKRADNTTYLYQESDLNGIFKHVDDPS